MENMFKDALLGAINTYIRMINDKNVECGSGTQLIENQYEYAILPTTREFYLYLIVNDQKIEIIFDEDEWHGYGKNVLSNKKLRQLHDDLIVV